MLSLLVCVASGAKAATITVSGTFATASGEGHPGFITVPATSTITHDGGAGGGNITGFSLTLNSTGKDARTLDLINLDFGDATVAIAGGIATVTTTGTFRVQDSGTLQSSLLISNAGGSATLSHQDDNVDSNAANVHSTGAGQIQFTVVPEPHEYAMMAGLGLLGFGVWRRKSMQAA